MSGEKPEAGSVQTEGCAGVAATTEGPRHSSEGGKWTEDKEGNYEAGVSGEARGTPGNHFLVGLPNKNIGGQLNLNSKETIRVVVIIFM